MDKKNNFDLLLSEIKDFAQRLDRNILNNLKGRYPKIWSASAHLIEAGGKRLRPFMFYRFCTLFNPLISIERILPVAESIELVHTFSLVHDDIMDKDIMRRGRPTVHEQWDEAIGILAGDLLFAQAFVRLSASELSPEIINQLHRELGWVSIDLCEGQTMDMDFMQNFDVSVEDYLTMVQLKTGALFRTCCKSAGIISNITDEKLLQDLEQFGTNLGIAFQLIDDILGIKAEKEILGKTIGIDIREKKRTYLLLYALENLSVDKKTRLEIILESPEIKNDEIKEVISLFKESNAIISANEVAIKYIEEAKKNLENIVSNYKDYDLDSLSLLKQICDFCLARGY